MSFFAASPPEGASPSHCKKIHSAIIHHIDLDFIPFEAYHQGNATNHYLLLLNIFMSTSQKDYKSYLGDLEKLGDEYLVKKAPALPDGVKEAIVKFGPWISLILMIISAPLILGFLGFGTLMMPFGYLGLQTGMGYTVSMVFTAVIIVMELIALPGLFKRAKSGWNMMYYASLVAAVQSLVAFNWAGLVIGTLLGLYVLFQVKSYYK